MPFVVDYTRRNPVVTSQAGPDDALRIDHEDGTVLFVTQTPDVAFTYLRLVPGVIPVGVRETALQATQELLDALCTQPRQLQRAVKGWLGHEPGASDGDTIAANFIANANVSGTTGIGYTGEEGLDIGGTSYIHLYGVFGRPISSQYASSVWTAPAPITGFTPLSLATALMHAPASH